MNKLSLPIVGLIASTVLAIGFSSALGCTPQQSSTAAETGDTESPGPHGKVARTGDSVGPVGRVGRVGQLSQVVLLDLDGKPVRPLEDVIEHAAVFVFVRTDCPISNRYAPEIRRLAAQYAERGIDLNLVYPSADETPEAIRQHLDDFSYSLTAFRDPDQTLVAYSGAEVTPEAIVIDSAGSLAYRGRIDNTYVSFANQRAEPTRRDLSLALDAILRGEQPLIEHQPAIGCAIPPI